MPTDYKHTILLPKTAFPMRAELPKREPEMLTKWREENLYGQIMAARREAGNDPATTFILADGPPFANGDAHMGHALNMVLKDIVLKFHNMSGHYAPFVPGWDCHGLPIEHKVMKDLGAEESDPLKIRAKCEATARHFIDVQREQFQRLGVFGDWAHPYATLDPKYEAETLRVFASMVGKDLVYEGLRPVYWSTGCQTALAEAEIEYKERVDPAIYVKFPILDKSREASLLIWTTTPWTLPANLAIAVSPRLDYALYELNGERLMFHTGLLGKIPGSASARLVDGPWKGSTLAGVGYAHPFLNDGRMREVYAADFVTADAGTGLVHIAPGHGQDDYQLGRENGLPVLAPVDDRGCLTAEFLPANADDDVRALVGQYVFKANAAIIEILTKRNGLFAAEEYTHEYPHCWRSKTPIVFRAVKQWFIKVDAFRGAALEQIEQVTWFPASGQNRIRGAVESRPDWCISRQRTWGIPLPVFYDENGKAVLSEKVARAFADLVEKEGSGVWFARTADELAATLGLPTGLRKGRDTLDVWIDSGTSWAAVTARRPDFLGRKADLYLEGSDQHRGWFQSSLLTSVATTGEAPYRSVLTHGFVVDPDGRKFSKSEGAVDLVTLLNQHGADVVRLWVASQDFQGDITVSKEILTRAADNYRSIRNTLRILLANLENFDAEKDSVPPADWPDLDTFVYSRLQSLVAECLDHYAHYAFSSAYQAINRFCANTLSALYVDVLKDRLYCNAPDDGARRAARTVLNRTAVALVKLLAPLAPFTAEEAWSFLVPTGSVHLQQLPATPETLLDSAQWNALLDLRTRVNERLETARRDKQIGKSLEGHVEIATQVAVDLPVAELEELFIVSKVVLKPSDGEETITVTRAEDHGMKKCVRCWKFWDHLGSDAAHPELCERCTNVVLAWTA